MWNMQEGYNIRNKNCSVHGSMGSSCKANCGGDLKFEKEYFYYKCCLSTLKIFG